ncbi:MAG: hypothetical protein K8L99_09385 [Anaerolineae bacterium]|nr:hypothetical protein [Anaerolineae bacterium]
MVKNLYPVALMRFPIFSTWILWHELVYPPDHPLFYRRIKPPIGGLANTLIVLLVGLLASCGMWTLLPKSQSFVAIMLLGVMGFVSNAYVASPVIRISIAISQEHTRHTYVPLCLLPSGALGAIWAICAAHLHHSGIVGWVGLVRKLFAGVFMFLLLMLLLTTRPTGDTSNLPQYAQLILDMAALGIVLYTDHVQSAVIGGLVGMLIPAYSRDSLNTGFWAAGVYFAAQTIPYLTALLILRLNAGFTPVVLSLMVFSLMRDTFIALLWRVLFYSVNGDLLDFTP